MAKNSNKFSRILQSKAILWILFIIALANMYAYIMSSNDLYIAFMLLIGFITSFFTKNMIIILFLAICIPNLIRFCLEFKSLFAGMRMLKVKEGYKGDEESGRESGGDINSLISDLDGGGSDKINKTLSKAMDIGNKATSQLTQFKTFIEKAKEKALQIEDTERREEVVTLLDLEENIVENLKHVGQLLAKSKEGQGVTASAKKSSYPNSTPISSPKTYTPSSSPNSNIDSDTKENSNDSME